MANPVADQLAVLRTALEQAGWTRQAAGLWRWETWTLRVQYVWGEATLKLERENQAATESSTRYYRGAESLTWLMTDATPSAVGELRKNLVNLLDKQAETV